MCEGGGDGDTHVAADTLEGERFGTGNQRHFIVPGAGVVYAQAGRFVIDLGTGTLVSVSGLDIPLNAEICAAIAPS